MGVGRFVVVVLIISVLAYVDWIESWSFAVNLWFVYTMTACVGWVFVRCFCLV